MILEKLNEMWQVFNQQVAYSIFYLFKALFKNEDEQVHQLRLVR